MVTAREKVGEEAIRKMGTQGEIAIKPKHVGRMEKNNYREKQKN